MSEEFHENEEARKAGEKSERLLQDTYLSGAVGMGAAGPRLSASALHGGADDGAGIQVREDHSWKSRAIEEGDAGEEPVASGGGLRATLRRWFGR
ncbi:MAG: hypothetical protein NTW58_10905 [Actinobacteria bacterium]|nr:hypothetical protein [Actinomycetota bacterium]